MQCASITVTFHPDGQLLAKQLQALPEGWLKVVVDNGTPEQEWRSIGSILGEFSNIEVIRLHSNRGIAAAQNAGMQRLSDLNACTHFLLLDQDTEPLTGAVEGLAAAYSRLKSRGLAVGAVGPCLRDPSTGVEHGFHKVDGWRWVRVSPVGPDPVRCDSLNSSGTFMALDVALALGGMDEGLFIDHVDTDWSFRLMASGLELYGVPSVSFLHCMGDKTTRLWVAGWRVWPVRSAIRHRYLFRNAVLLLGRPYVPRIWKLWAVIKLSLTALVFSLSGPDRLLQVKNMVAGVWDGLFKRSGPL